MAEGDPLAESFAELRATLASEPRRVRLRAKALGWAFLAAVAAFALFGLSRGHPSGDVLFTGLDDSAQTALSRSIAAGAPLVYADDAFAAVPRRVRRSLLYRPSARRKTRDLAHQVNRRTCEARPFFQPFLPWQRAHLPQLPLALFFAAWCFATLWGLVGSGWPGFTLFALVQGILMTVAGIFLVPWIGRFALGPYAEGPATGFAAVALVLSFLLSGTGRPRPRASAATGLCLGLAATFHPTLALYAVPIALFDVVRNGSWRCTLALALGAAAGLAPLVWSTLRICAPYGNFLDPAALRRMVAGNADIRVVAAALALAVLAGAVLLALAHLPRLRAAMDLPRARAAVALAAGAAILLAATAAWLHPAAHRALAADRDGILLALPPVAAAAAMALWFRRPATCALLAGFALAALPFFVVQGQEVHVGLWSLRRSLPPFALIPLAATLGAFQVAGDEVESRALFVRRARMRRLWVLLAFACAVVQGVRLSGASLDGGEKGADALRFAVESRMRADGLYLFDYFPHAVPFAWRPGTAVFGLNEDVAKSLRHDRVVRWLRKQSKKRPVFVVSSTPARGTVLESGVALVPEGDPVEGTVSRVDGRTFGTAKTVERKISLSFLRVRPAERGDATELLFRHAPFGLAGGWDGPRRGKPGRWARVGAGFWGPVPEPGGSAEIEIETAWTPPPGADWPEQTLRVIPPWDNAPVDLPVRAGEGRQVLRATLARPADDGARIRPTALWRLSTDRPYDPAAHGLGGYPPDLVAPIYRIRIVPAGPGHPDHQDHQDTRP